MDRICDGRVCAITGGARGIGLAYAEALVAAGARVVVNDVDRDAADTAIDGLTADGGDAIAHVGDVSTASGAEQLVQMALDRWGRIDVVVNNAGITRDTVVWKMTDKDWNIVLGVHLGGTFAVTRAVVPHMRANGFGRIINVTSFTGLHGTIGQSNYAAAKGGIVSFTKTVAKETAKFGITVNAISPNAATAMVTAVGEERLAAMTATVPVGRFAEPSEMATAVGFLAADESSYVTGIVLPVDGGLAM